MCAVNTTIREPRCIAIFIQCREKQFDLLFFIKNYLLYLYVNMIHDKYSISLFLS